MVAAFDGAGAEVRVALLRAIGGKGPKLAAPAMALLERLMKGDDLGLRYHAAGVLGTLRSNDPRPVEICRKGLQDYEGDELWEAAHAIGVHTSVTRKLVPGMAALLKSDHPQVRMNAIISLTWLRGDAKAALLALKEIAKTGTENERLVAARAIRRISGRR